MKLIKLLFFGSLLVFGHWLIAKDNLSPTGQSEFGVVEGFWFPDMTCDLHPGWERIIFDWAQHQPTGPDDWHTLNVDDRWLKAANRCDREVVAVLKHTPDWATDGTPGPGVPRHLSLALNDPDNAWANFVRRAVDYYASRGVNHFVIGNEPDILSDTYGHEFEGDLDDYFIMLKTAYLVAKETNSASVIHLAGTTYWHDVNAGRRLFVDRLLERIQADSAAVDHDYYFDVLSLHIYFRTDTVYDIVSETRALLAGYGMADKAVWINETNAAPTDDPGWPVERPVYQLNLEQQAAFLMQSAALGLSGGADRIAVYKLYDQQLPAGGESFGILSPVDASPRPAYLTWQTVIRYLSGVEQATVSRSDRVNAVSLRHENGRQTVIAWARTANPVTIRVMATGNKALILDQYGYITEVRPVDGLYEMMLPGATCNSVDGCPVGGRCVAKVDPAIPS